MAAPNLPSDPTGADAVIAELAALVIDLNPPIVALAPHLARLSDPARTAVLDAVSAFRYQMHADDPGRAA